MNHSNNERLYIIISTPTGALYAMIDSYRSSLRYYGHDCQKEFDRAFYYDHEEKVTAAL